MTSAESICKAFIAGEPISTICKRCNVHRIEALSCLRDNHVDTSRIKVKLSNLEKAQILEMFDAGQDIKRIGEAVSRSSACVREFIIISGRHPTKHSLENRLTTDDKEAIMSMYSTGGNISSISREFNVCNDSIKQYLISRKAEISSGSNTVFECQICGKSLVGAKALAAHLNCTHSEELQLLSCDRAITTSNIYYDEYMRQESDGICVVCGESTSFGGLSSGYLSTCSHRCGAIAHRRRLRGSPDKFNTFKAKVSTHRRAWWSSLTDAEKEQWAARTAAKQRAIAERLTDQERRAKYGWLNKLEGAERDEVVSDILNSGCHKWWRTASEEDKKRVHVARWRTTVENMGHDFDEYISHIQSDKDAYTTHVRSLTEAQYTKHKAKINPNDKPRGTKLWHIDHKFSVSEGFRQNIPPHIIAHYTNLQMLHCSANNKKRAVCSMTQKELLENYEKSQI